MGSYLEGKSLPEALLRRAQRQRDKKFYFSKKDGQWVGKTYGEILQFTLSVMSGLEAIQFQKGDTAAILAENREEWVPTDYAVQWMGGKTAAIYTTNTPEQIRYILKESDAKVVFVSSYALAKKLEGLSDLPMLKVVVTWDQFSEKLKVPSGATHLTHEEFLKAPMSEAEAEKRLEAIQPDDTCVLLYTSGTTGEPKGVMLSHRNFVTNIRIIMKGVPQITENSVSLSFLPMSHIYERICHNALLHGGAMIHLAESIDKLLENIQEIRPEIMVSVPRIFEKMYVKILEKVKNSPAVRREIFYGALEVGKKILSYRSQHKEVPAAWKMLYRVADQLVFKQIRAITGGRARIFVSGGAPLSQEIAEFFFAAGFTILEGYGLSESGLLAVNRANRFKFGTVGIPFDGVEVKIAPDGEIIVRGDTVMKGYFKRPDATAEVMDSDGWFHTGDIGEIDSEGFIKITDRKKDLIVTAAGKKVAPQPIENSLKADPLIESVCLVGDNKKYVVALIVPNFEMCQSWAKQRGESLKDLSELTKHAGMRDHFQKTIDKMNAELPPFSTIKYFELLPTSFTIENGLLTPTLKLKRRLIQDQFRHLIDSMYKES